MPRWFCPGHIKVRTLDYPTPCPSCTGYARKENAA